MQEPETDLIKASKEAMFAGDDEQADALARQALREAEAEKDTPLIIAAMEHLSFVLMASHRRREEYESVRERLEELRVEHLTLTIRDIEAKGGSDQAALVKPLLGHGRAVAGRLYELRHDRGTEKSHLDQLFKEASALYDRAEAICIRHHTDSSAQYARFLLAKGEFLSFLVGDHRAAVPLYQRAVELFTKYGDEPEGPDRRTAQFTLASTLRDAGQLWESAATYEELLATETNSNAAHALAALLAPVYRELGRDGDAERIESAPLAVSAEDEASHPRATAMGDMLRAHSLMESGQWAEAAELFRKSIEGHKAAKRKEKPFMIGVLERDLARCLLMQGLPEQAEAVARTALDRIAGDLGEVHFQVVESFDTLTECLAATGNKDELARVVIRARDVLLALPIGRVALVADIGEDIVERLRLMGMTDDAEALAHRLSEIPDEWEPSA